jgi:hypothetical protein
MKFSERRNQKIRDLKMLYCWPSRCRKESPAKECKRPVETRKGKNKDSPLKPQKGMQPYPYQ